MQGREGQTLHVVQALFYQHGKFGVEGLTLKNLCSTKAISLEGRLEMASTIV